MVRKITELKYDLTGQTFGRWTVLRRSKYVNQNDKAIYWDCKCTCGKVRPVQGRTLRYGKSRGCASCGAKGVQRKRHNITSSELL